MRKITTVRTAAATLALCAAAGLTTAANAAAAPASGSNDPGANRPALEVPFPCGDVWSGQTRGADDPHPHNPLLAIDFNLPTGGDSDLGRWVQASNAGTVTFAGNKGPGYGNTVDIYHKGGWSTRYAHLKEIAVDKGQVVTARTGIGRVGKSGGQPSAHLHYEQRWNNDDQVIYFGNTKAKYWGTTNYTRKTLC